MKEKVKVKIERNERKLELNKEINPNIRRSPILMGESASPINPSHLENSTLASK